MGNWLRKSIAAFWCLLVPDYPPKYGACPKCYRMAPLERFARTYKDAKAAPPQESE